jgi:DnaA family protein
LQQLPLGVRIPDRAVFESFLPARNQQAVDYARTLAAADTQGTLWISGAAGAGKTHLLQAITARAAMSARAGYIPLRELATLGPEVLEGLTQLDCLCLDDLDTVVGELPWERALFQLLREIIERGGRLVAAANAPPALLAWQLQDLGSRFTAAAIYPLRMLDEDEQRQALQLRARLRGFELPDETSRWLLRRFPRDMRVLYELLETLDEAALIAQRRLTVPFIRSVLKE